MEKEYLEKAVFHRKASCIEDLQNEKDRAHPDAFKVEKQILLSEDEYACFKGGNLMKDWIFLFDNKEQMYFEVQPQCWYCLLVTSPNAGDGVLVESEGYCYARYAAFVADKTQLDLSKAPVQDYRPQERRRASTKCAEKPRQEGR